MFLVASTINWISGW